VKTSRWILHSNILWRVVMENSERASTGESIGGGLAPVPLTDTIRDNQDSPPAEVIRSGLASHAPYRYYSHRADVHWLNGKEASS